MVRSWMSTHDIVVSYKQSANKQEQIEILADLTASDAETIIEVLKDAGVFNPNDLSFRTCKRCGEKFFTTQVSGVVVCETCKRKKARKKMQDKTIKRLRKQIERYEAENEKDMKALIPSWFVIEHRRGEIEGMKYAISLMEQEGMR